jgi:hypothetical protein
VHEHAAAALSSEVMTRCFNGCNDSIVVERTIHSIAVSAGTMLALSPPLVMIPWIRSVGRMC